MFFISVLLLKTSKSKLLNFSVYTMLYKLSLLSILLKLKHCKEPFNINYTQSLLILLAVSQLKLIALQDGVQSISKAHETFSTPSSKQSAIKMIFTDTQQVVLTM